MKVVRGDLIKMAQDGAFDVILHGCNCQCSMGKGIAKTIRDTFPTAYAADKATIKGDVTKLGTYSSARIEHDGNTFTVVNGYIQEHWRGTGARLNYGAMRALFKLIKADFGGLRIGYPKIGGGLAGGDWDKISSMINEQLEGEDHTLVLFGVEALEETRWHLLTGNGSSTHLIARINLPLFNGTAWPIGRPIPPPFPRHRNRRSLGRFVNR